MGQTRFLMKTIYHLKSWSGGLRPYFKYRSTKEMNLSDNTGTVTKFRQRDYYEHVMRNDMDLRNKSDYLEANPLLWAQADENPIDLTK